MDKRRKLLTVAGGILIVIISLFIYTQIASHILFSPLDFDEGYNLQISQHLKKNLFNYSTFSGNFDPNITTGPALLIPSSLFINPSNPLIPRLIMIIFAILFIFICQVYMYTGQLQRITFLILISFTPLFYFFSSHVLGELPGFVFFLISLIMLSKRKYLLSGLFLALSILTKQVYIFGILSVILQFALIHIFSKKQRATIFRNIALVISGFLIVFLSWYLYILSSVNFSYSKFNRVLYDYQKAARILSQPKLSLIDKRLEMFTYVFGINGLLFTALLFLICKNIISKFRQNMLAVPLAFFVLIYTIYFLFFGSTNWYRHFFPSILALVVCLPFAGRIIFDVSLRRKAVMISFISVLILGNLVYYFTFQAINDYNKKLIEQNLIFRNETFLPLVSSDSLLKSQMQTADYIKNNIIRNDLVSGISWWNAPEIEYLNGRKIYRDPFNKDMSYLITHFYGEMLGKNDYQNLNLLKNKEIIYKSEGYTIYKIKN